MEEKHLGRALGSSFSGSGKFMAASRSRSSSLRLLEDREVRADGNVCVVGEMSSSQDFEVLKVWVGGRGAVGWEIGSGGGKNEGVVGRKDRSVVLSMIRVKNA